MTTHCIKFIEGTNIISNLISLTKASHIVEFDIFRVKKCNSHLEKRGIIQLTNKIKDIDLSIISIHTLVKVIV